MAPGRSFVTLPGPASPVSTVNEASAPKACHQSGNLSESRKGFLLSGLSLSLWPHVWFQGARLRFFYLDELLAAHPDPSVPQHTTEMHRELSPCVELAETLVLLRHSRHMNRASCLCPFQRTLRGLISGPI